MKKSIFFSVFFLFFIKIFSIDFVDTPTFPDKSYLDYQIRSYESLGKSYDLKLKKMVYTDKINDKWSYSVAFNDMSTDENNPKYISDYYEFKLFSDYGRNKYMIYYLKNKKSNFYDSVIFYFGIFGFGFNFSGSDDVNTIARFGKYDVLLLKTQLKNGVANPDSGDFIDDFFLVMNYSLSLKNNLSFNLDYNGDIWTYSLRYSYNELNVEWVKFEKGDYYELAEFNNIKLDDYMIRISYLYK